MKMHNFNKAEAEPAHEDTILAQPMFSEEMDPPFGHAWGYLEGGTSMAVDSHAKQEIYIIVKGKGTMVIDGEEAAVEPGDIVEIPSEAYHHVEAEGEGPLLWAALWWPDDPK
ncbi:MAG: cupin domain-containing protein [Bacillota bacterium]